MSAEATEGRFALQVIQHHTTTYWCKGVITDTRCRLHITAAKDNSQLISSPAGAFLMTSTLYNYRLCNLHNKYT